MSEVNQASLNSQNGKTVSEKKYFPSKSYREAREHLVYRLSELVFGSLLASYMLGFVGATASKIPDMSAAQDFKALIPVLAQSITYLLISVTFAYVTAGLYISYHSVVLTRPTVPLNRMRWDFLIALLQAVCFGISLLNPLWFPFSLSISLWASIGRQKVEYNSLVDKLIEIRPPSDTNDFRYSEKELFKDFVKTKLSSSVLRIWLPVSGAMFFGTFTLMIGGIGLILLPTFFKNENAFLDIHFIVGGMSFILFFLVLKGIFELLKDKPKWVTESGLEILDQSFEKLLNDIQNYRRQNG